MHKIVILISNSVCDNKQPEKDTYKHVFLNRHN